MEEQIWCRDSRNNEEATEQLFDHKVLQKIKMENTCYECKKIGYYLSECDEDETVKTSNEKGSSSQVLKEIDTTVTMMMMNYLGSELELAMLTQKYYNEKNMKKVVSRTLESYLMLTTRMKTL